MDAVETLKPLAERWKGISDAAERDSFYEREVFPEVRRVVREAERRRHAPCAHLVLTVGLSPEPLILSIDILRPQKVCFLYTAGSEKFLDRIHAEAGLSPSQVKSFQVDETNVPEIYSRVKEIYELWAKPGDIAVDISGGKKSMVGGCALAASFIKARLFYIDSQFNNQLKKPEPGSERLCLLDNPYDVFGDLELARAQALFEELDFSAAQRLLEELGARTSVPQKYLASALLCQAYAAWDSWEIGTAHRIMGEAIREVGRFSRSDRAAPLVDKLDLMQRQAQLLQRLDQSLQMQDSAARLQDPAAYLPLAATLRACALRQEKRAKLDSAALLWYRLVELLIQQRLSAVYGLDSNAPGYAPLCKKYPSIQAAYGSSLKKIGKEADDPVLPSKIGLLDGYLLLDALKDPLTRKVPPGDVFQRVQARNAGLFAHGFKPISRQEYDKFKNLAEKLTVCFQELDSANQSPDWEDALFMGAL